MRLCYRIGYSSTYPLLWQELENFLSSFRQHVLSCFLNDIHCIYTYYLCIENIMAGTMYFQSDLDFL